MHISTASKCKSWQEKVVTLLLSAFVLCIIACASYCSPYTAILGQVPGTEIFQNISDLEKVNNNAGCKGRTQEQCM